MAAKTSGASAICGTHFGLTNADTSITGNAAALNRLTNSILSAVETAACSFCRPSRGPTSTTVMCFAICPWGPCADGPVPLRQFRENRVRVHEIPFATVYAGNRPVCRRTDGQLHFHGFEEH